MKKTTFYKTYDGESLIDLEEDIYDQFTNGNYEDIPVDKKGIMKGKFRVSVVWCSEDDCDCVGFDHHLDCPHHVMCY